MSVMTPVRFFIFGCILVIYPKLYAMPITSPNQLDPGSTIIDFESFPIGASEPLVIGNVTIQDDNPAVQSGIRPQQWVQYPGIFEGQFYGTGTGDRGFIIEFDVPVSQFGMGVFDPNFSGNIFRALDMNGNLLEQIVSNVDAEFPVGPPGGGFSTYVGFVRGQADIQRIELKHVAGDWLAIDNLSYSQVPIPASVWFLITGILGWVGMVKKKL